MVQAGTGLGGKGAEGHGVAALLTLFFLFLAGSASAQPRLPRDARARLGCPAGCEPTAELVCGYDGRTYRSACDACPVGVVHSGPCRFVVKRPPAPVLSPGAIAQAALLHGAIDLFQWSALPEAAAEVPGVTPVRASRASGQVAVRGLSGRRVLLVYDGIRLNPATLEDAWNPDLGVVDLFGLWGLDVRRGPASAAWGGDAVGGVIELIGPGPTRREEGVQSRFAARFASAELERALSARIEALTGGLSTLGGLSFRQTDPVNTGSDATDPTRPGGGDLTQLAGDLQGRLNTGAGELSLHYLGVHQSDLDERPLSAPLETRVAGRSRDLAWLGWRLLEAEPWLAQAEVKLAWLRHGRDLEGGEADGAVESEEVSNRGLLIWRARTPLSDRIELSWAVEGDFETVDVEGPAAPSVDEGLALVDGSTYFTASAVAGAFVAISPVVGIDLALRVAWIRAEVPEEGERGGAELSEVTPSGSLSLTLAPSERVTARLGASTGAVYPNLRDLSGFWRSAEATTLPNADLSSEQAVSIEAGARLQTEGVFAELVGHYTFLMDGIVVRPTGELDAANRARDGTPLPFVQPVNLTEARLYGLELWAAARLGEMRLDGQLAWTRGEDTSGDGAAHEPLPFVAPLNGRVALRYLGERWGLGPYLRFALEQDDVPTGISSTPGYAIVGVAGYLGVSYWGRLVLTVDNLADDRYRTHGSTTFEPGLNVIGTFQVDIDWTAEGRRWRRF